MALRCLSAFLSTDCELSTETCSTLSLIVLGLVAFNAMHWMIGNFRVRLPNISCTVFQQLQLVGKIGCKDVIPINLCSVLPYDEEERSIQEGWLLCSSM